MPISQGFSSNSMVSAIMTGFIEDQLNPGARDIRKSINTQLKTAIDDLGADIFPEDTVKQIAFYQGVLSGMSPGTSVFNSMQMQ